MLGTRVIAALVLAAVGVPVVILGGVPYFVLISLFLCLAAWEYVQLFKAAGFQASRLLVIGGTAGLLVSRAYFPEYAARGAGDPDPDWHGEAPGRL
jgi:CDP-diglyceride synthetase